MSDTLINKLRRRLKKEDVLERVGFVLKSGRTLEVSNVHPEPDKGFLVAGADVLRHIQDLVGVWHTHPQGSSQLSQDDHKGFLQWPHLTHYVIGRDGVRTYCVQNGAVLEAH